MNFGIIISCQSYALCPQQPSSSSFFFFPVHLHAHPSRYALTIDFLVSYSSLARVVNMTATATFYLSQINATCLSF